MRHEEKFKQLEEENNDLKQLLLLLLPSDKKQMVQEHFDTRKNSALTRKPTKTDDFSSHMENRIIQDDMNQDHVSYLLLIYIFLFLK